MVSMEAAGRTANANGCLKALRADANVVQRSMRCLHGPNWRMRAHAAHRQLPGEAPHDPAQVVQHQPQRQAQHQKNEAAPTRPQGGRQGQAHQDPEPGGGEGAHDRDGQVIEPGAQGLQMRLVESEAIRPVKQGRPRQIKLRPQGEDCACEQGQCGEDDEACAQGVSPTRCLAEARAGGKRGLVRAPRRW